MNNIKKKIEILKDAIKKERAAKLKLKSSIKEYQDKCIKAEYGLKKK